MHTCRCRSWYFQDVEETIKVITHVKKQAYFTVVCLPQIIKYLLEWSRPDEPDEQAPLLPLLLLLRRLCPRVARLEKPPGSAKH